MNLLYTSGTARGGTNYRTLVLNNHSSVRLAIDPLIPLFRFYRDSLLDSVGALHLLDGLRTDVLDDYYFSSAKLEVFRAIRRADPDIPFRPDDWPALKESIARRMSLASMNLISRLDELPADTFRTVFQNFISILAGEGDGGGQLQWVGFNDNWTVEFFPMVARLFPKARFMVHLRDPRAVVHSSEFAEPDPAKRPTVVSFARGLRKYLAFASVLPDDPELEGRVLITRYEECIDQPEVAFGEMLNFLGLEFESGLADVSRFRKADGTPWPSKASHYAASVDGWRDNMPVEMVELTEFVCDPEMRLFGYQPEHYDRKSGLSRAALEYALANDRDCLGWRSDFSEIERTLGSELFRQQCLRSDCRLSDEAVARCFLFPEVHAKLRGISD